MSEGCWREGLTKGFPHISPPLRYRKYCQGCRRAYRCVCGVPRAENGIIRFPTIRMHNGQPDPLPPRSGYG